MGHSLKTSPSDLFVGASPIPRAELFRLEVSAHGHTAGRFSGREQQLGRYIAAGGMRQLRRTHADDIVDGNRRRFGFVVLGTFCFWLIFYFLPSGI